MSFDVWECIFTRSSARSKTVKFLCFVVERKSKDERLLLLCVFLNFFWIFFLLFFFFKNSNTQVSLLSLLSGAKKRARFVSIDLLRVQINIAENAHAKIHTATSVPCVHFQFSFHRDGEVTHMHEHPKKSFLFLVYFQNQKFFDHTIFSPPLWLLFLKKTKEEEEEEKKRKKKLQISSLAVSYYIHTYKELAQRRRSKTERRRANTLKWPTR